MLKYINDIQSFQAKAKVHLIHTSHSEYFEINLYLLI